jgi:membrane associated rhomboid family serine protease
VIAEVRDEVDTAELDMSPYKPAHHRDMIQKAAEALRWLPVGADSGTLAFRRQGADYFDTQIVFITLNAGTAMVRVQQTEAYYQSYNIAPALATQLRDALPAALVAVEHADRNLHPMHREKYGALVPSKSYLITPLLVYLNALVFVVMVVAGVSPLHPTGQDLYMWGGNLRPAVAAGEWWRLLTYMVLHGGGMHLLMNTYALLYIGMFLEPLLGKTRFAAAYIFTGICAGLLSMVMHTDTVSVGASGAIFGMYGVYLSVLTTSHIQRSMRRTMLRSILFFVVFNLIYGLQGNTDNAAHVGGLLSGIIIGYIYYPGMAAKASVRSQVVVTAAIAALVAVVTSVTIYLL